MNKLLGLCLAVLSLSCSGITEPKPIPNIAGVWRLDGFVTDNVNAITCQFKAVNLYISQSKDSTSFTGQSLLGSYECTDGTVFPFPAFYLGGKINADNSIEMFLVPYFTFRGRLTQQEDYMSGKVEFGAGNAFGEWTASRESL